MKLKKKKGFTLIELLIVVAIIAILAAIAIPQFAAYRIRGFNAAANSDVRNAKTAEEALFADFQSYGQDTAGGTAIVTSPTNFTLRTEDSSKNLRDLTSGLSNNVSGQATGGDNVTGYTTRWQSYLLFAKHAQGDRVFGADGNMVTIYWKAGTAGSTLTASGITSTLSSDLTASGFTAL